MPRRPPSHRIVFPLFLAALTTIASVALACAVPVFRYALERWPADRYTAAVYHAGDLSPADEKLIAQLRAACDDESLGVNLAVTVTRVDSPAALRPEFAGRDLATPMVALSFPKTARGVRTAWAGPLHDPVVASLLDSPARRTIAQRILAGESAVWLLLESGNKAADDAAEQALREAVQTQQERIKLAVDEIQRDDAFLPDTTVALRVAFSVLRVSRADPAEAALVAMLMASEADLHDFAAEPLAFPVFGRGRVLYGLAGKGINSDTIAEACRYITGACSCQVKEENPGIDLLVAADWENLIRGRVVVNKPLPDLAGLASLESAVTSASDAPAAVAASAAAAEPAVTPVASGASEPKGMLLPVWTIAAGAVVAVAILAAGVVLMRTRAAN